MIHFVSTFPPIPCGVGSYTSYLSARLGRGRSRVTSFRIEGADKGRRAIFFDCSSPRGFQMPRPRIAADEVVWLQHAFGMWGNDLGLFLEVLRESRRKGARTVATFHTTHFGSGENPLGTCIEGRGIAARGFAPVGCCDGIQRRRLPSLVLKIPEIQRKDRCSAAWSTRIPSYESQNR
jgi:hypothetical protein